jgi:diguanylate cyclase (GGDEF)-like protein
VATSREQIERALELARKDNNESAVADLEQMLGDQQETSPLSAPSAEPAAEQGALPAEIDYTDPEQYAAAGALQMERERGIAQSQYDRDRQLAADPANKPNRTELRDWMRTNTDFEFGAGPYDYMGRQVIKDPKTGKLRWTALSPDDMDRLDKRGSGVVPASIGALASDIPRYVGGALENVEAEIENNQSFQNWMLTEGLPKAERDRIMGLANEQYGPDSRYVKNPGLIPARRVKEWMDQNPDNEATLDAIEGKEWGARRKEWWNRLSNVTMYGLPDRKSDEELQYETPEDAPAFAGASELLRNWKDAASTGPQLYRDLVLPLVKGTTGGETPGELVSKASEEIRKSLYSEEQEAGRSKPLLDPDVEINNMIDLARATVGNWDERKGLEDIWLMFMENAASMGIQFAVNRNVGRAAASRIARTNPNMSIDRLNKMREAAAGRAGVLVGAPTEALMVSSQVEMETREILGQVPMEKWRENPMFQALTEGGLTEEAARQIMAQQSASEAGVSSVLPTMLLGSPMSYFIGKSGAGRLIQDRPMVRRTIGALGEPTTEGAQEIGELLATEAAVKPIDPDNPIFANPNRYAEAFGSGFAVAMPVGLAAGIEPSTPAGIDKKDAAVARATVNFMTATNERFKYETKITDPEHIANTTPNQRIRELEKLETLQEKEAQAILDAEPKMRKHLEEQGTITSQTELRMLNRLVMRANSMKTDIAVARSKRTTAASLQEEERRVMQDRADLQRRVNEDIIKLEDIERLTTNIEKVQNLEAITGTEADELIKEGYAKRRPDGQLTILPKGKRATKELNRQARGLRGRLESGYTGAERRQGENIVKRGIIEEMGPVERERALYTDPLTDAQNRRAFNERQENIDVKEGRTKRETPNAAPAVASVDVDSLKWVNDNMTHSAGDRLLMAVSDALGRQEGVEVYRMGGDEFAVTGASQEALETALQQAAADLADTEIVAGNDSVTPTITWGKGENYEQADAEAVDMKRDRVRRGVVANRKGKPSSYKVRSQGRLFQMDQVELPRTFARVKELVERGDSVEILTPDGATMGVVTQVKAKRGRGRIRVNVQGREFLFNADSNHLIVDQFTDPADLAWITGDAEYAQPGRESLPQIVRNVSIGHLGKDGVWYADLGADYEPDVPLPWWFDTYPNLDFERTAPVVKLPEASEEDMVLAESVKRGLLRGFGNLPPINLVRSMEQLKREAPQIVDQIIREGGNLRGVRGYMDHINPQNGVYVFVQNLEGGETFQQAVAEVLAHEIIGHYGVRGFFGDEAELRNFMNEIVDTFPRLSNFYALQLGLDKTIPEDKQLIGEEMVAYIAGQSLSGKEVFQSKKEKNLWQRFLTWIREFMTRRGWDQWAPVKKIVTIHDTKEIFWNDERIQDLLFRSMDFVRNGKGFEWRALGGTPVTYMRDGHIFQSGVMTALESATFKPTKRQKQELAGRYGGKDNVPDEVPLFPDKGKVGVWQNALTQALKENLVTERDLELSGLSDASDWNLFRDATYGTLKKLHMQMNNGIEDPQWHHGVLPAYLSKELDDIAEAMNKNSVVGPMPVRSREGYGDDEVITLQERPSINKASGTAMRSRIADIMNMEIDKKKTLITRDMVRAHLLSDAAFRVRVRQAGNYQTARWISYEVIARRLFGDDISDQDIDNLTEEQKAMIKAEQQASINYGWDIGYDEEQKRWFDWTSLITTEGANGEMGYSGHYEANLMHIRTGVATLLDYEDKPLITSPNPARENQMLSLIELQSDWLQKLRKGFASGDERQRAQDQVRADSATIQAAGRAFGIGVREDLRTALTAALTPIANLPDGREGSAGLPGGSMMPEFRNYVREETGRQWDDLDSGEKFTMWRNFTSNKIARITGALGAAKTKLAELYDSLKSPQEIVGGSMDVRGFEGLDNIVARDMLTYMMRSIDNQVNQVDRLAFAENQANFVEMVQGAAPNMFSSISELYGMMSGDRALRMPMLDYRLPEILEPLYKAVDADPAQMSARISGLQVRESATVRIAKSTINDLATATLQTIRPAALVEEMLSASRISRHTDIPPGDANITVLDANEDWIDVSISGNKANLEKLSNAIPDLIKSWIENRGKEKRQIQLRAAEQAAGRDQTPSDFDYRYNQIEEWLGMEDADTDEGDSLTREYEVSTFYEFEENEIGEIESQIIQEAFDAITETEWNTIDNDHPGVGREGSTYREALEIDEDGDVDNRDAEEALQEAREEYRREVLWDDEDIRMQAYEQIRELWYDRGPTALAVGSLPISWDEDGDPIDSVSVVVIAKEPGDNYSIEIDGEEYDYMYSFDDAKEAVPTQIGQFYEDRDITPPFGSFYAPDEPEEGSLAEKAEGAKQQPDPNWEIVGGNIVETIGVISEKPERLKDVFERYVTNYKRVESGGTHKPTPLAKDEHWRPLALKYLISDAVRRGFGGVVWNNGLSSSTRGGIGLSDITTSERITWTKEMITVRGEEHSVYVIRSPELRQPLAIAPQKLVPVLGTTTTRLIMQQERGKIPIPSITSDNEGNEQQAPENDRDKYLISQTDNNIYAVYRRSDHELVGFANNDEELDNVIENDAARWRRPNEETERERMDRERMEQMDPERIEGLGRIESRGLITQDMVGNKIHIIGGGIPRGYSQTFRTPLLAGARQSYEEIMYKIWNKELKKYGVHIKETYVKARDMRKAIEEEGAETLQSNEREQRIAEEHGSITVKELSGDMHGYVIVSEKQGVLFNDVWTNRRWAEERLQSYITDTFGNGKEGVKVFYFEITDEMREEFSKPVAPFMQMAKEDPALDSARQKVGTPKGSRMRDLRDRIKVFRQGFVAEAQQGIFDQFYGIKRALYEAGLGDDPYISARLTTSLDSMMKGVLYYGHPVWKDGIVQSEGKGLMEVLQPILTNHEDWGLYMAGKRAKDLMMEGYAALEPDQRALLDKAAAMVSKAANPVDRAFEFIVQYSEGILNREIVVTPDDFRGEGLSDMEQTWIERNLSHFKRKPRRRKDGTGEGRSRIFDWRKVEGRNMQDNVDAKWDAAIKDLMSRRYKVKTEAEARAILNKLTDIALRKQEQADAKRAAIMNAKKYANAVREKGRENLFEPNEIKKMIELGDSFPQFERVAKEYAEFNKKLLDFAQESGLINADERTMWESANYVPFYRVQDDRLHGTGMSRTAGLANQRAPIRRLKGGKQNIGDIVGNIMMNTAKLVDASVKNNAALETIDALRGTGIISKKALEWKPALISMDQLKKVLIDRGVIVDDDKEGIHLSDIDPKALEGFQKMFAINAPKGEGVLSVMRDGKREYYYTDDPILFRAMTSINKENFKQWIELFRGPKRLLTTLITIDPAFMVANFLRDTMSSFVIGRDHAGNVPFVSALEGLGKALFETEEIRTMTMAGAAFENGYITGGDPTRVKRLIKQAIKDPNFVDTVIDTPAKAARLWLTLGSSVENSNRVAIYQAAIRAGKSKKRAAFEAKDLMDFSMGGDFTIIRFLIQTVPFLNARNQGLYRLGKSMVEHPVGFTLKGMLVGLAGFALWSAFKDDERYKELEMWDRHAYFHFWIGDMHYRIPKPFEVGALFNTVPEMWGNYYNDQETDAGKMLLREFGHMLTETFAWNPIPQTLLPGIESAANYNFFRQSPIVSYYEQKRLPPDQYRYRTSPALIELSKRLPKGLDTVSGRIRSPLHLQNLWAGYTGTIGSYMLDAADWVVTRSLDHPLPPAPESQDVPVYGRFIRGEGPPRRTKYEGEVYKLLDKTTAIQGSLSFHEKYGRVDEYLETHSEYEPYIRAAGPLEDVRENIQEVNKAIQMIYLDTEMDRKEKQKQIDLLEETRNTLFREAYKLRPGGEYNPEDSPPVTSNQIIEMIDEWGVDNSTAFMQRIEENAPSTYELLEMVQNDMSARALRMLARVNE